MVKNNLTVDGSAKLRINMSALCSISQNNKFISFIIIRDTLIIGVYAFSISASGGVGTFTMSHVDVFPDALSTTYTYSVRVAVSASTWFIGQDKFGNDFGGLHGSSFSLMELN